MVSVNTIDQDKSESKKSSIMDLPYLFNPLSCLLENLNLKSYHDNELALIHFENMQLILKLEKIERLEKTHY